MKVSKRVREAAIHALDLAACNWASRLAYEVYEFSPDWSGGWPYPPITALMQAAWRAVPGVDEASLAEAACLLRDGWLPGEDVVHFNSLEIPT